MVFNGGDYNQSVVFQLHFVNVNIEFNSECSIQFDDAGECFRDHTLLPAYGLSNRFHYVVAGFLLYDINMFMV